MTIFPSIKVVDQILPIGLLTLLFCVWAWPQASAAEAATDRMKTYEAPLDVRATAEAKLVGKPTVARMANGVRIGFEVSKAVDVEVAVLGADGKVIRHLAAGLLGPNAPAPFRRGQLKQDLVWDGRDDSGKPVLGGAAADGVADGWRIRVRIGATPELEKTLGRDPDTLSNVGGLTVSPKGELYVLVHQGGPASPRELRVLDRDGRYLRTIMPYSAKTPLERTKSVGHLMVDDQRVPIVFNGHAMSLYPLTPGLPRQTMAWNPRGHLVVASATDTAFEFGLPRHLLAFHPEGGAPDGVEFVGPEISTPIGLLRGLGRSLYYRFEHMVCSPDGKYIYYTGNDTRIGTDYYSQPSRHAIFRFVWDEDKGAGMEDAFYGVDCRPGGEDRLLNEPRGLAVDAQGNLYICDRGNHRVMIVSPEGKLLGKFDVQDPEQIAVHPKTGEIYLLCRQRPTDALRRDHAPMFMPEYRAWRARARERWERRTPRRPSYLLKLGPWSNDGPPRERFRIEKEFGLMALDASDKPTRLWVTVGGKLQRLQDKGGSLEPDPIEADPKRGLVRPGHVVADPERNRVLVFDGNSVKAVDITSGAIRSVLTGARDIDIAPDGTICVIRKRGGRGIIQRLDPTGVIPLPFGPEGPKEIDIGPFGPMGDPGRSLTVAPNGDIYVMRIVGKDGVQNRIDAFTADGKVKQAALVDGLGIGDCGLGVDVRGNLYMGVGVKPSQARLPKAFRGQVPESNWLCWVQWVHQFRTAPWYYSMRNEYLYHYGAVMKFGPEGGAMYGLSGAASEAFVHARVNAKGVARIENAPEGATEYRSGYLYHPVKVHGAHWRFPGTGIVPTSERYWGDPSCVCLFSRLDADAYGRVFAPDCFQFRVHVLDANGNQIGHVGKYGNADDEGPDIHFAWPAYVHARTGKLYVTDVLNRRIVVVRFRYADEAEVAAP